MFIKTPDGAIRTSKINEIYMERTENESPEDKNELWGIFARLDTGELRVIDVVGSEEEAEKAIEKTREELNSLERGG